MYVEWEDGNHRRTIADAKIVTVGWEDRHILVVRGEAGALLAEFPLEDLFQIRETAPKPKD